MPFDEPLTLDTKAASPHDRVTLKRFDYVDDQANAGIEARDRIHTEDSILFPCCGKVFLMLLDRELVMDRTHGRGRPIPDKNRRHTEQGCHECGGLIPALAYVRI